MIYSKEYMNMYFSVKMSLHTKNVEKISVDQLEHIGKPYNKDLFSHYKKIVFLRWVSENTENKISFAKRVNKLLKKLDIELTDSESTLIEGIEPREFTERRAFKTIEVPYKDSNDTAMLLQPHAYFFYKGIRTYHKRKMFFKKLYQGEIYMTIKEVVLYDRKNDKIQHVIPHIDIMGITLRNEYVEIKLREGDSLYLRTIDNELIYISLKRTVTIRNGEGFNTEQRMEFLTAETTIESFLSVSTEEQTVNTKLGIKSKRKNKKK